MINKDKYIADIIIISYKNAGLTINCVESIRETLSLPVRIIIVDNASPDNTVPELKSNLHDVEIIENKDNKGYAQAVNIGVKYSKSQNIIISNNDVIYHDNALSILLNTLINNKSIGVVGPSQQYPDGSWQRSHGNLPGLNLGLRKLFIIESLSNFFSKFKNCLFKGSVSMIEADYLDGACLAVRRDVFESVGGFDVDYFFYTEEADFCHRIAQKQFKIICNQKARITHLRGGSDFKKGLSIESIRMLIQSKLLFCKKHLKDGETFLYVKLETMHYKTYTIFLRLLTLVTSGKAKSRINVKLEIINNFHECWNDELSKIKLSK